MVSNFPVEYLMFNLLFIRSTFMNLLIYKMFTSGDN